MLIPTIRRYENWSALQQVFESTWQLCREVVIAS